MKIVNKLLMIIAFAVVLSCSSNKTDTVRIGSFSVAVDYGPYLIAKNKGWFEEAIKEKGVKVEYTVFQSLPPINESFATDRIDIVFEAAPPAIVGKSAGIELEIEDISCTLVQEILVHNNEKVNEIKDLQDKKIAVLAGTSSHYGLFSILNSENITKEQVEIIDMVPPDAKNAFVTGQIDAWAVWPPWVEQEVLSGNGKVLKGGDAFINSVLVVRRGFKKDNKDLLDTILKVFNDTKTWMINNEKESIEIIAKELNIEASVVELAWDKHNWSAIIDGEIVNDIQKKADFLKENNFIQNSINVNGDLIKNED